MKCPNCGSNNTIPDYSFDEECDWLDGITYECIQCHYCVYEPIVSGWYDKHLKSLLQEKEKKANIKTTEEQKIQIENLIKENTRVVLWDMDDDRKKIYDSDKKQPDGYCHCLKPNINSIASGILNILSGGQQ